MNFGKIVKTSYKAKRWCRECRADTDVTIELHDYTITMDCGECGSHFDLKRF